MRADGKLALRTLYPPIQPYAADWVSVENGHRIYVEQSGDPDGIPVLFVHGGPGGGTSPVQRRFFNPRKYRIILFDQRGCGKSQPHASLVNNTTQHLISDMECIRQALSIDSWLLFGGSWGSTLSLLYAQAYPEHTRGLILRGIFLMRERELDWFYKDGTSRIFPDAWVKFKNMVPEKEQHDLIAAYYKRLTEPAFEAERLQFAKEWSLWEASAVTLMPDEEQQAHSVDPIFALAFARIEAHYFHHRGFLNRENQILEDAHKLEGIPTTLIQGRYDSICPPESAWELAQAMPWVKLKVVPVAGHSAFEAAIQHELICATDAA